jgi:5-methylcytosine-specific restriction endonuclease McrA
MDRKPWSHQTQHRKITGRPWRRIVERVKLRDKYTCHVCGRVTDEGDVDHIMPLSKGGTDFMDNLGYICRIPCHADKTMAENGKPPSRLELRQKPDSHWNR